MPPDDTPSDAQRKSQGAARPPTRDAATSRWSEVSRLVDAALELPPEERPAYLARACAGDADLSRKVERFLRIYERVEGPTGFLAEPAPVFAAPIIADVDARAAAANAAVPAVLAAAFAGRYEVERELGRGGMATVYLARDLRHKRPVAVKVLRPELAAALGAERFLREIETAANLTHPHILALYDSGEAGGLLYYVMPYVEGESLRDWLRREQQLPVGEAVALIRTLAGALDYAHRRGVVHRDVKPENVLLSEGQPLLADFGIALAPGGAAGDRLTETGRSVGTPQYMSPEQASGEHDPDARSDIYSLACVLYEALAGEPPFAGPSAQAILARRVLEPPRSITLTRPSVPAYVDAAVRRALSPTPADRFATAGEFADALAGGERSDAGRGGVRARWIAGAALAALAAVATVAGVLVWRSEAPPSIPLPAVAAPTTHDAASLVVLPFVNVSSDEESEYFSDGMTDELINALSRIEGLRVVARTSAFSFKGKGLDAREIARRLAVAYVLEGSVRKTGRHVRVTAQLIDAGTGFQLWSEKYDRTLKDVLAIQDDISNAIASRFRLRLGASAATAVARTPESEEALELYLKGRYFWNKRTGKSIRTGLEYFQQAVDLDPGYSLAWVGIADSWIFRGWYSLLAPREAFPKARAAALKALEFDSTLAEAHASMAHVHLEFDHDWVAAEREYHRAIQLNPRYPIAHHWYGGFLSAMGRHEEALRQAETARGLDPLSPIIQTWVGLRYYFARRYEVAIAEYLKALELDRNFAPAHWHLGWAYEQTGQFQKAVSEGERALEIDPDNLLYVASLGHAYALAGKAEEARATLARLAQAAADRHVSAYHVALIHIALGDVETGLAWLDRAYDENSPWIGYMRVDPRLDPVRSQPRFERLLRKARLDF